ncbi:MAG: DUF4339 domain-containing protein [Pirellulales bacterium]
MWYFRRNDENVGPFDDERMLAIVRAGIVKGHEYVWAEGMPAWTQVGATQFAAAANLVSLLQPGPPPDIAPLIIADTAEPPPFDPREHERLKNPFYTDFGGRTTDAEATGDRGMSHVVMVTLAAVAIIAVALGAVVIFG